MICSLAVATLAVTPAATSAGRDSRSFSGNVCSVFSAAQVAVVVGDPKAASRYRCVPSPSKKTPEGITYSARSGTSRPLQRGFFTVELMKYSSPAFAGLARNGYLRLRPVQGIGDWAYEEIGPRRVGGGTINIANLGELAFGAHSYVALLSARAARGKKVNRPALRSLARALAKRL